VEYTFRSGFVSASITASFIRELPVSYPRNRPLGGLYGCEMLRIPHCLDNRLTDGGKIISPTHRPRSSVLKHYFSASGTLFCQRLSE
jgi:hypothetical protein